ncbi:MAG: excinuclease ABC subunit UvrC, partial [Gammaproteobacteria bacterium]|nr:excinuclease ABC subunit UvrC [Gammaproteobacteria bacterium]
MTSQPFDHKDFLKNTSSNPGVYRMFNAADEILYVGKAKNLKKRLASYFRKSGLSPKTLTLVNQIDHIEVTITHTEGEALLLENNLIKEYRPRYNVLLRDDKSYPYIYISDKDDYPRIVLHRGSKRQPGKYLGPYPNAGAVRESLNFIHKLFKIRQCEDSYFNNRSRPCLQYQIKRCTAPCMAYITPEQYQQDIDHALMFLEGKSTQLIEDMVADMEAASERLDFEKAADYRDQIRLLQKVVEKQYISGDSKNIDVIGCVAEAGQACVQVFFIRDGRNLGNRSYFPQLPEAMSEADVLSAFVPQFYMSHEAPTEIILSHSVEQQLLIEQVLAEKSKRKLKLSSNVRGDRARWVDMALNNAQTSLNVRNSSRASMIKRFEELQGVLQLDELPGRIECFDISHTQGEATVASCVVFTLEGACKNDYRRFNI